MTALAGQQGAPAMSTPFGEMPARQTPYPFSVPTSTDVAVA
jgi:hypothetical protein